MEYNKTGRVISSSGPRDVRRRQRETYESSLLDELKKQIVDLKTELEQKNSLVSIEKDEEIRNVMLEAIDETKSEYRENINNFKNEIKMLKEKLLAKEEIITILKSKTGVTTTNVKRPKMKNVFVDPLEKDAGKNLKPHIKVEGVFLEEKEDMAGKVKKLRGLVGNLNK